MARNDCPSTDPVLAWLSFSLRNDSDEMKTREVGMESGGGDSWPRRDLIPITAHGRLRLHLPTKAGRFVSLGSMGPITILCYSITTAGGSGQWPPLLFLVAPAR